MKATKIDLEKKVKVEADKFNRLKQVTNKEIEKEKKEKTENQKEVLKLKVELKKVD